MSSEPVNQWDYQKVWELMHESTELIVNTKNLIVEQKKSDNKVNRMIYENLVGATAVLYSCIQIISAMTTEEDNGN